MDLKVKNQCKLCKPCKLCFFKLEIRFFGLHRVMLVYIGLHGKGNVNRFTPGRWAKNRLHSIKKVVFEFGLHGLHGLTGNTYLEILYEQ